MNVASRSILHNGLDETNQLSLYERYSAVAYGVILQILPQPQQAQEVLIDLFASPDVQLMMNASSGTTCAIVRLARARALDYRQKKEAPLPVLPASTRQNELIFKLLFYQNQPPELIADRLQIQRSAVFGAVREFFAHLLPS